MSVQRNPLERYKIIHDLLARDLNPNWKTIAEACISNIPELTGKIPTAIRRTIFLDLKALKEAPYNAPIISVKGKYQYDPSKPGYSLFNVLNTKDATLAHDLKVILKQYAAFPMFKGLEPFMLKIEERYKEEKDLLIDFEQIKDYEGLKFIFELYENIKNKKCLTIEYEEFLAPRKTYTISPYLLKEYNNRWHLYGWDLRGSDIINLPLDRIKNLTPSSTFAFREKKEHELSFLNDIIGFTWTKDNSTKERVPKSEVVFKVKANRAKYIVSKPIHHSQRNLTEGSDDGGYTTFCITVYPNKELTSLLLSFGDDLTVISPIKIREEMAAIITGMFNSYQLS